MISDEDLEALRHGSNKAFQNLLSEYSRKIYNLCLGILQNEEDAEDTTQEIFTTIFTSIQQFKGDSKLSTWIYRISVNKCKEHIRKSSRKKRFGFLVSIDKSATKDFLSHSTFHHPGVELENKERARILFFAINKLPENQKIAFTMHKIEGIPYEEIAASLNTSLSSIESLLFRAKQNLKKELQNYYEENEN